MVQPKNEHSKCSKSCWTLILEDCKISLLISPLLASSQPPSTRWLLVLDVPLRYGVATVVTAVIPCNVKRISLEVEICLPFPGFAISGMRLHWTRMWLVTAITSSDYLTTPWMGDTRPALHPTERWGWKPALPLDLTAVLSWSPEKEEGIRGFSAVVEEEFLFFSCLRRKYNKPLKNKVLSQHWSEP